MAIVRQTDGPVHSLAKSWFALAVPKCQNIELHDVCDNSSVKSSETYISLEFYSLQELQFIFNAGLI